MQSDRKPSPYIKTRTEVVALGKQFAIVFLGFAAVLIFAGGNPSNWLVSVMFGAAVAAVAFIQHRRHRITNDEAEEAEVDQDLTSKTSMTGIEAKVNHTLMGDIRMGDVRVGDIRVLRRKTEINPFSISEWKSQTPTQLRSIQEFLMFVLTDVSETFANDLQTFTNDLRGVSIGNFANQMKDNARQDTSNFLRQVAQNADEISQLIDILRNITQELPETQRDEALVHLDDLQEDLSKSEKRTPQRIKIRIIALLAIAYSIKDNAEAADFSKKVLELAERLLVLVEQSSQPTEQDTAIYTTSEQPKKG